MVTVGEYQLPFQVHSDVRLTPLSVATPPLRRFARAEPQSVGILLIHVQTPSIYEGDLFYVLCKPSTILIHLLPVVPRVKNP